MQASQKLKLEISVLNQFLTSFQGKRGESARSSLHQRKIRGKIRAYVALHLPSTQVIISSKVSSIQEENKKFVKKITLNCSTVQALLTEITNNEMSLMSTYFAVVPPTDSTQFRPNFRLKTGFDFSFVTKPKSSSTHFGQWLPTIKMLRYNRN